MWTCTDASTRNYVGQVAARATIRLFRLCAECDEQSRSNVEAVKNACKVLDSFMDQLLQSLKLAECQRNWTRLENFFRMLLDIATSSLTAA